MEAPCQLCRLHRGELVCYFRWHTETGHYKEVISSNFRWSMHRANGCMLVDDAMRPRLDMAHLETGQVIRQEYKKPLPQWLNDPLIRAMALATGTVPQPETKWKKKKAECPPAS